MQGAGAAVAAVPASALPLNSGLAKMRPKSVDVMTLANVRLCAGVQKGGRAKKTIALTVTPIPRYAAKRAFL